MKYTVLILSVGLLLATNGAIAETCKYGSPASGTKNIKSTADMRDARGADFHKGPGLDYDRKPYQNDPDAGFSIVGYTGVSSAQEVELLCKKGNWVKVAPIKYEGEKIEPNPSNFGMDDQVGWIQADYLEDEKSPLEKQGLWWSPDVPHQTEDMTQKQVDIAVKGALQLLHNSPACNTISSVRFDAENQPSQRYIASCENAAGDYSQVRFGKAEVLSSTGTKVSEPYPEVEAIQRCKDAVVAKAVHPSSIDWSVFGTNVKRYHQELQLVTLHFSAQNSFGATFDYRAVCQVLPTGRIDSMNIAERP